jgi:hypothetical protein
MPGINEAQVQKVWNMSENWRSKELQYGYHLGLGSVLGTTYTEHPPFIGRDAFHAQLLNTRSILCTRPIPSEDNQFLEVYRCGQGPC